MNTPTQQTGGEAATPRTDNAALKWERDTHYIGASVPTDFARQLERETATLHAQIARMKTREGELVGALQSIHDAATDKAGDVMTDHTWNLDYSFDFTLTVKQLRNIHDALAAISK